MSDYQIEEVDIEKAQAAIDTMRDFVSKNAEEITIAENAAKAPILGLLLTGVHTGLFKGDPKTNEETRAKLFMSFDIGYLIGKKTERRRVFKNLQERFPEVIYRIKATMEAEEWLVYSGQKIPDIISGER